MRLYVGNLPYRITEGEMRDLFGQYGEVVDVRIIQDRETRRSRGFGFVEMSNEDEGTKAIENLNDFEVMGRNLKVNKAKPRE